uniref:Uncharacterized protein n=1 Tax=Meloidogyne enterolobii TaxID=390850 RepID=A0A6V7ULD4_MELEN|nr:unnamed protein product [Meloidogyne enterolobii]
MISLFILTHSLTFFFNTKISFSSYTGNVTNYFVLYFNPFSSLQHLGWGFIFYNIY